MVYCSIMLHCVCFLFMHSLLSSAPLTLEVLKFKLENLKILDSFKLDVFV
jgi:hypothetical protein